MPTLTPLKPAGADAGAWSEVPGAELVPADVIAVHAGRRGVLLLRRAISGFCATPGGDGPGAPAAFYDARTRTISKVPSGAGLAYFAAGPLPDGRVLVAGGQRPGDVRKARPEPSRRTRIWDPRTRAWTEGPQLNVARAAGTLTTLSDGRLLLAGGTTAAENLDCYACDLGSGSSSTAEIYDPRTNRWTRTADIDLADNDDVERILALPRGKALALGLNATAAVLDPGTLRWRRAKAEPGWGPLVVLRDGRILGFSADWYGSDGSYEVPVAQATRVNGEARSLGHWNPGYDTFTTVLRDGRVLYLGEMESEPGVTSTAEVFDPASRVLTAISPMPLGRGAGTALAMADGSVLVVGGVSVWETDIVTEDPDEDPGGDDTPVCVPAKDRAVRWDLSTR